VNKLSEEKQGEFKKRIYEWSNPEGPYKVEKVPLGMIEKCLNEAQKDLEKRLYKLQRDVLERHLGGCVTYDNLKVNVYAEWVKDWFGKKNR